MSGLKVWVNSPTSVSTRSCSRNSSGRKQKDAERRRGRACGRKQDNWSRKWRTKSAEWALSMASVGMVPWKWCDPAELPGEPLSATAVTLLSPCFLEIPFWYLPFPLSFINPAPTSGQDQLALLCLPSLSPALPALPSLLHCCRVWKEGVVTPPHGKSRNRHQVTDKMHKHNSLLWKQLMALLKHFSQ